LILWKPFLEFDMTSLQFSDPELPFSGGSPTPRASQAPAKHWERLPSTSPAMRQLEDAIERVASFECPVLITGETGCGKEEIARAIHAASPRRDKPFVTVNCGGVVAALAESQLFGHEKGAFTGAFGPYKGVFRSADGGVVLLDEIGELPGELQPKLLRVLQRGEVTPVGSPDTHHVDVVVLAATHRDLAAEVDAGLFREDLLYRLNTIHLEVPPLRARPEDIPGLIEHFSGHFARLYERPAWQPDLREMARLVAYPWPGNVRQLAQTIQRLFVFHDRVEDVLDELDRSRPDSAEAGQEQLPGPAAAAGIGRALGAVPAAGEPGELPAGIPAIGPVAVRGMSPPPRQVANPPHVTALSHRALASAPPIAGLTVEIEPTEPVPAAEQVPTFNLEELRRMAVRQALAVTAGHRGRAARLLGVSASRMSKLAAEACPESVPRTGRRRSPPRQPR
jgi:DNA-binding NtrC family response regulator